MREAKGTHVLMSEYAFLKAPLDSISRALAVMLVRASRLKPHLTAPRRFAITPSLASQWLPKSLMVPYSHQCAGGGVKKVLYL